MKLTTHSAYPLLAGLFSLLASIQAIADAVDLNQVYQDALANDAQLAAAKATRKADGYAAESGSSDLYPKVNLSYSISQVDSENSVAVFQGSPKKQSYKQTALQLQASQALFNLNSWYKHKASSSMDDVAAAQLQLAEQQMLLRTASAYFDVLRAQDMLSVTQAESEAVKKSLQQTQERFEAGLIAKTDVLEAQANYDLTQAKLFGQETDLTIKQGVLEQATGQSYEQLQPLAEQPPLGKPQPASVDDWLESGLSQQAQIKVALANKETVNLQRKATRSALLPTVELVAGYSSGDRVLFTSNETYTATQTSIGLNISVPIYNGGVLYSKSKESASQLAAAEFQLEHQRRTVSYNVRRLFHQVTTDVLTIQARQKAVQSAQAALVAVQTGYEVGTRTIIDVLNAQQSVFQSQQAQSNAQYDYINNLLSLKFYAGTLNEQDIQVLNGWLSAS